MKNTVNGLTVKRKSMTIIDSNPYADENGRYNGK